MKKILLFTLCAFISFASFAQSGGVNWEKGTFAEALKKAKSNKKGPNLVFLDCYTSWCGPCKYMANTIFPTKEAGDYFNKNFVNIKIDMEKGEGVDIAKKYSISAYPTFLILDGDGNEIGRIIGGGELDKFIKQVDQAKDIKNSPAHLKSVYDADKTVDNAVTYLKSLSKAYRQAEIGKFLAENITVFKERDVFTAPVWDYFSRNLSDNKELLSYLLKNKIAANGFIGNHLVDKSIVNAYGKILTMYLVAGRELTREEVTEAVTAINLLSSSDEKVSQLVARLAELRMDNKTEEIAALYNIMNFWDYKVTDLQSVERIFGEMKEITKEQIEKYYTEQEKFYKYQLEGSSKMKDYFIKSRE